MEKEMQTILTARHILPLGNKVKPAKSFTIYNILLLFISQVRIPFPSQLPLIRLIELDTETTEKYDEEKVPEVALDLCGSAVPSVTSYVYT